MLTSHYSNQYFWNCITTLGKCPIPLFYAGSVLNIALVLMFSLQLGVLLFRSLTEREKVAFINFQNVKPRDLCLGPLCIGNMKGCLET